MKHMPVIIISGGLIEETYGLPIHMEIDHDHLEIGGYDPEELAHMVKTLDGPKHLRNPADYLDDKIYEEATDWLLGWNGYNRQKEEVPA